MGRLWKEFPDSYGADAVLFEASSPELPDRVVAHRIQLKLGKSLIKEADAHEIVSRLLFTRIPFDNALSEANYTVSEHVLYLVTTRPIHPHAEAYLRSHHVRIFGQRFLKEKIWPPVVRSLGKPFC